jgi:hypothetical protein
VTSLPADSAIGPAGSVVIVDFTLFGQTFMAMSGIRRPLSGVLLPVGTLLGEAWVRPRRKRKERPLLGLDGEKVFSPGRNFRAKSEKWQTDLPCSIEHLHLFLCREWMRQRCSLKWSVRERPG